jgi:hypothetical protein
MEWSLKVISPIKSKILNKTSLLYVCYVCQDAPEGANKH